MSTNFSMTMYTSKKLNQLYRCSLIKTTSLATLFLNMIDYGSNNRSNNEGYYLKGTIGKIKLDGTTIR